MKCLFPSVLLPLASLVPTSLLAAPISGMGTWETTLQARDLDLNPANGPEAFYDTVLNVTWMRAMSPTSQAWATAKAWAEQDWWGISGWRLPRMNDLAEPGCAGGMSYWNADCGYNVNPGSSELAHLHHVTLGNVSVFNPAGEYAPNDGIINTGVWGAEYNNAKWLDTVYQVGQYSQAWVFEPIPGMQDGRMLGYAARTMAVIDGDRGRLWSGEPMPVSEVPLPASSWLVALGLAALGIQRRSHATAY